MENHEYQAPGPDDARSPCPALNTLANHGYLPRDGKNITPKQLIDAAYEGINLTKVLSFALSHINFLRIGKTWEGKLSLDDLFNEAADHPMSLIRPDKGLNEDYKKISPELLESLFSEKNGDNKLTTQSFARQHIKRRDQSLKDNPNFHGLNFLSKNQIFGEYALTLICFPESENGRGKEINVDTLKSIYQFERFPENWKKAETVIGVFQVNNIISEVGKIVDGLDKEGENKK